jgi:hypothetical protein
MLLAPWQQVTLNAAINDVIFDLIGRAATPNPASGPAVKRPHCRPIGHLFSGKS